MQSAVGVLHDDDEFAVDFECLLDGADERMAHFLDALERLVLLVGANTFIVHGIAIAVDEFDGFDPSAGGLALPNFTEAARAQGFNEAIPRDGFGVRLAYPRHVTLRRKSFRRFESSRWPHAPC